MKLAFFIAALVAFFYLTEADDIYKPNPTIGPYCPKTCHKVFVCDKYKVEKIWSIVDNQCRVFQNQCYLDRFNCERINQCLPTVGPNTIPDCERHCNFACPSMGFGVCATFYKQFGSIVFKMTFTSKCHLDQYACQNGVAYSPDEVTLGPCPP
ncbi:uncharacterized protein LOC108601399 [Drosophila busckii]|uniref:uncharacterized protein LOC108601399 n=1 Tax=Drosophila busckii TaxID=30019 RepID=UPI00083F2873|nr:uncharacterized protein LOC108601399 [Drosophila busckii]